MIKFWEYPITFQDPASVYAYHLFSVHHDIIWFLIIILILVYWCLYKVITDFNWHTFNNGASLSYFSSVVQPIKICILWVITNFELYLLALYYDCVDLKELYNLGVVSYLGDFVLYFVTSYINKINLFFGLQSFNALYSKTLLDIDGKVFFNDEIHLFDPQ